MTATVLVPGDSRPVVPSRPGPRPAGSGGVVRRPPTAPTGTDAQARQIAEVVALLDHPVPVLGRLAGVPHPGTAATRAVAVGLLRVDDSGQLVCADDIRRQAVLRALPVARRQELQARSHAYVAPEPAGQLSDPDPDPPAAEAFRPGSVSASRPRPVATTAPLTSRESQILALVDDGWSNGEIAYELRLSDKTVEFHVRNAFGKLGVASRRERRRQRRG